MINNIGIDSLSQFYREVESESLPEIISKYKWRIDLYHQSGGFKKSFWMKQKNEINKLNLELNKKLLGRASLNLIEVNFPIDADDYIFIYYENTLIYRGLIDDAIDPKGGSLKIIPYSEKFNNLLINEVYVNMTLTEILEDLILNYGSEIDINWNEYFVDIDDTDTYNFEWEYETLKKAIDEIMEKLDDREWGLTPGNLFVVYQQESDVDTSFFWNQKRYSAINNKKNSSKVKATRYQVFRKIDTAGKSGLKWIGQVGYGGLYPVLTDIENQVGKIVDKYIISSIITDDTQALEIAYADLTANAQIPETTKISNFDYEFYFPEIGKKISVEDVPEYIVRDLIYCDNLNNDDDTFISNENGGWYDDNSTQINVSTESSIKISDTGSIKLDTSKTKYIFYDFSNYINFLTIKKLMFMIYCNQVEDLKIVVSGERYGWSQDNYSIDEWSENDNIEIVEYNNNINQQGAWQLVTIDISEFSKIKRIKFEYQGSSDPVFYIDRVQTYQYYNSKYEQNIVQINFEITGENDKCDIVLNQYDIQANDSIFLFNKKINKLEAIAKEN